jgi:hypothetical protein
MRNKNNRLVDIIPLSHKPNLIQQILCVLSNADRGAFTSRPWHYIETERSSPQAECPEGSLEATAYHQPSMLPQSGLHYLSNLIHEWQQCCTAIRRSTIRRGREILLEDDGPFPVWRV